MSDGPMEAIKLLPQIFYDLISRVIPGVLALVMVSSALGQDLGTLVTAPFQGAPSLQGSPLFLTVAIIGASYILGQLIGPLSDLLERRIVGALLPRRYWTFPAAVRPGSPYPAAVRSFVLREMGLAEGEWSATGDRFRVAIFLWYDWLRVWSHEAGARVEKIRAEYRMFGGVAVAAVLGLTVHLGSVFTARAPFATPFFAGGLFMLVFSCWGLARMYRTFERSVLNQYYVAREGKDASQRRPAEELVPQT